MLSQQLNKKITIEKGVTQVNTMGSPQLYWEEYITPYSKVSVSSGDNRIAHEGQIFVYTTDFLIRYNSKSKLINNKYRVKYNDNYYKIIQVKEVGIKEGIQLITVGFSDDGQPDV